jgi:hypothetical protein
LNALFATETAASAAEEVTPRPFIRDYGEYFVLRALPLRSTRRLSGDLDLRRAQLAGDGA